LGGGAFVAIIAISLATSFLVKAIEPQVDGLTYLQVREVLARIALCTVGQEQHVCAAVDDKIQVGLGRNRRAMPVLKGM
jgi:hypothetical protein